MDEKLSVSHFAAQKANHNPGCIKKSGQQVEGSDTLPLQHSGETFPGVVHPVLESLALEGHKPDGSGLEKGHRMTTGLEQLSCERRKESWGSSAWRGGGCRESSQCPFST